MRGTEAGVAIPIPEQPTTALSLALLLLWPRQRQGRGMVSRLIMELNEERSSREKAQNLHGEQISRLNDTLNAMRLKMVEATDERRRAAAASPVTGEPSPTVLQGGSCPTPAPTAPAAAAPAAK